MDITTTTAGLAMASGALVGGLLALFGGGGSVLATPLLLYVVGVRDPHVAIGASAGPSPSTRRVISWATGGAGG